MSPLFCILALPLTALSLMRVAPFTQRRQVKRVYFNYNLHLNLDCHIFTFINTETGISLLLLCSLAVCLPIADGGDSIKTRKTRRTESIMSEILVHTQRIQRRVNKTNSSCREMLLYTPDDVSEECFNTSLNCFVSEMEVIDYEFKLICEIIREFGPLLDNAKSFENHKSKNSCTACEEFQEHNVKEFLDAFVNFLQSYFKTKPKS